MNERVNEWLKEEVWSNLEKGKGQLMSNLPYLTAAQVKRLQKFRKAATFKIQDLPDNSGRMIKMTSDILGVSSTETSSINGEMKKKESVGK